VAVVAIAAVLLLWPIGSYKLHRIFAAPLWQSFNIGKTNILPLPCYTFVIAF